MKGSLKSITQAGLTPKLQTQQTLSLSLVLVPIELFTINTEASKKFSIFENL